MKGTIVVALIGFIILVMMSNASSQTWVIMPAEDTWLFLQADDTISPQVHPNEHQIRHVDAEYDEVPIAGTRANRDWVEVGHWVHTMQAPITAEDHDAHFEFWWTEVDEGYDNEPDFRIYIKVGDWDNYYQIGTSEAPQDEPHQEHFPMDMPSHEVPEGETIEFRLEYRGWEDMELHYMCSEFPSGILIQTDALRFYKMEATESSVTILMGDHFYIDWSLQEGWMHGCIVIDWGDWESLWYWENYEFSIDIVLNITEEFGIDLNFSGMLMTWDIDLGEGDHTVYVHHCYNNLSFGHLGYKNFTFKGDDDTFMSGMGPSIIGIVILGVIGSVIYFRYIRKRGVEKVEVVEEIE